MSAIYSWCLGLSDNAYYIDRWRRSVGKSLFCAGWGNIRGVFSAYQPLLAALRDPGQSGHRVLYHDGTKFGITWDDHERAHKSATTTAEQQKRGGCCGRRNNKAETHHHDPPFVREGSFPSPHAKLLPPEAAACRFLMVAPAQASVAWRPWEAASAPKPSAAAAQPDSEVREVLVMLPSTGEQGYGDRLQLAKQLAASRGAVSLIVMAPLYAARKPAGQRGASAGTVGVYLAQSLAIMSEAAALVVWAHERYPACNLCITGFSWGAAMSGCAALLASAALPPGVAARQLSVAPYVGSCSPAPVVDGILAGDIAWDKLLQECDVGAQQLGSLPDVDSSDLAKRLTAAKQAGGAGVAAVREALLVLLGEFHIRHFVDQLRQRHGGAATPVVAAVSSCCAENDWFLGKQYSEELHQVLSGMAGAAPARVRQKWLQGGHLAAYATRLRDQKEAVNWALDALTEAQ